MITVLFTQYFLIQETLRMVLTGTVEVFVTKDSEVLDRTSSSFNKVLEDRCRHPPPCNMKKCAIFIFFAVSYEYDTFLFFIHKGSDHII